MPSNAEPLLEHFRNVVLHIESTPRRVRDVFAGVTVADTRRRVVLRSVGARRGTPVYYVPAQDVRLDLLRASNETLNDPHLGQVAYYDIVVGDRVAENATWRFDASVPGVAGPTISGAPDLRGYVAFRWAKLDAWFEEDEEVIQHARDPYVWIDCLPSTRHVRVVVDGETVAETTHPILLFETVLITRYYIPKLDVRMDLLRPSSSRTLCPYKGQAHYYSLEISGRVHEDMAWYYPQATRQAARIAGSHVAFFEEQVDYIEVDGVRNPRPDSHFAREAYQRRAILASARAAVSRQRPE